MTGADIGVWGLGVMGTSLALNIAEKGFSVAVYERERELAREFARTVPSRLRVTYTYEPEQFLAALRRPRQVLLMIKAGRPVDLVLAQISAHLSPGDVLIDGGNSHYRDTIRRHRNLTRRGILFLGCGVSGGEHGARTGPALMAGGSRKGYAVVEFVLAAISARVDGEPCCAYLGGDGAGHFVKMVHNGIEYGCMQLISEAYELLRSILHLSVAQTQEVFAEWSRGVLNGYLIEITADILSKTDPATGRPLVEMILDKAGQKGTGAWTSQSALTLGVAVPTLAAAVFARCISFIKEERATAAAQLRGPEPALAGDARLLRVAIHDALHASMICCYAQGFALMAAATREHAWELDFCRIARLWRGGCIVRAGLLDAIADGFARAPPLPNLLLDEHFKEVLLRVQGPWRQVVATATQCGTPVPALSSALGYFDSYRTVRLSANLIQAQRDYFGGHTYERIDKPGAFHTDWSRV